MLEPRISTHGKAYVYGTKHVNLSLLFGGCGCGDFDGMYGFNDIPFFMKHIRMLFMKDLQIKLAMYMN